MERSGTATTVLTAGAHIIRFSYSKDAQGDEGLDTAWVDDVRVRDTTGATRVYKFDQRLGGTPDGWVSGGAGGGFGIASARPGRGLRRPSSGAFTGYTAAGVKSSIERTFTWPAESTSNSLEFDYLVDSEANRDFLKIYIDGDFRISFSGRYQFGHRTIPVSVGTHVIKLEYSKDESVDEGLDDARVTNLRAVTDVGFFQLDGSQRAESGEIPPGGHLERIRSGKRG